MQGDTLTTLGYAVISVNVKRNARFKLGVSATSFVFYGWYSSSDLNPLRVSRSYLVSFIRRILLLTVTLSLLWKEGTTWMT